MRGIAGIWNLDGRPAEKDLLARLGATLAYPGHPTVGQWIDGPVGLACRLHRIAPEAATAGQPFVHESGAIVVFDGRLDNREELLAALDPAPGLSSDAADPLLVATAYAAFGDRLPERLVGDFALALFDPARQQLLLARDPIGLRPLYFWRSPRTFLFASTIKTLLRHPAVSVRPNDGTIARSVLGRLARDDHWSTCFEGVSRLPPAHLAVITLQRFVTRQYWDFDPHLEIHLRSIAEYAEAFRHHFDRAVRRCLRSAHPVAVSLSGGLDSSSIYCLAEGFRRSDAERYPPVVGISYVRADGSLADESAHLDEIERMYGVSVYRHAAARDDDLLNGSRQQVWESEVPLLSLQWRSFSTLLAHAHQLGARVLLTGQSADQVLIDEAYLIDLFRQLRWCRVWTDLREIPRWLTDAEPGVFTRDFFNNLVKFHCPASCLPALQRLRATVSPSRRIPPWYTDVFRKHACMPLAADSVRDRSASAYATSMYRYATSPLLAIANEWYAKVAATHGLELRAPFLDRDLLAFLLAVPGEIQTWRGVPKTLLREAMGSVLPGSIAGRRSKGDYTEQANDGVRRMFPEVLRSLQSGGLVAEFRYVDRKKMIDELLRLQPQIRGPLFTVGFQIWRLIGLELWLQVFFGDPAIEASGRLDARVVTSKSSDPRAPFAAAHRRHAGGMS